MGAIRANSQGSLMTRRSLPLRFLSSGEGWTLEFEHAFRAFYAQVFEPAFPDPDIRESAANLKRLSDTRLFGGREPRGFIDLAMTARGNRGTPVAGILYELFRASEAALVTYVAVTEGWRGKGVATTLLDRARRALEAERLGTGKPLLIFAETEMETESEDDRIRLRALGRLGFAALDCNYVQPPLAPGKHHVPLRLLVYRPAGDTVPAERVGRFLRGFYRGILGEGFAEDRISQEVLVAIAARESIAVQPLSAP